jgi:hypothetical protein
MSQKWIRWRHTRNLWIMDLSGCTESENEDCLRELKGSVLLNTTHTKQDNYGLAGQVTFNQDFMGKKNQFIVGTGFDYSLIRFKQNERVNISSESEADDLIMVDDLQ